MNNHLIIGQSAADLLQFKDFHRVACNADAV